MKKTTFARRTSLWLTLMAITCAPLAAQTGPGFGSLKCEQETDPVGIETPSPRFSWQLVSPERGCRQTAYRIVVAGTEKDAAAGRATMWDSGKVPGEQSLLIPYDGQPLEAAETYYWSVRVWGPDGKPSAWSPAQRFTMGLPDREDWSGARWIALEEDVDSLIVINGTFDTGPDNPILGNKPFGRNKLPLLRREFTVDKPVRRATAYVCGLGQFELFLNGEKTGDHFLDPAWTKFDKEVQYVSFDVSDRLRQGANAVGAMLGNGFFNIPRERYSKFAGSYGAPKMIFKLQIEYEDGTRQTVVSDDSWKAAPGPVTFSSIYGGEDYDAGLAQAGWTSPDFDDSSWSAAVLTRFDSPLRSQRTTPIKIRQRVPTVRKYRNSKGNYLYDLGQNASGIVRLSVRASGRHTVRMFPGELCRPDSTVNQRSSGGPVFFSYTTRGDGSVESWQPQFTYYGFRYVEVEGAVPEGEPNPNGLPEIVELTGLHTTNSAEQVGTFECSNPLFNQIYTLIDWAIRSNFSSVFTDCPHREKLGWLEQSHLIGPSIQYGYDISRAYPKIVGDMATAQHEDGMIPTIAPQYTVFAEGFLDTPEWGSAFILLPYYLYRWYGDDRPMRENYDRMADYIDYLSSKADGHIVAYGLGDWCDIGPAEPAHSQLTSNGVSATAIYYYDICTMRRIAEHLGKTADAERYESLAAEVKKAFNGTPVRGGRAEKPDRRHPRPRQCRDGGRHRLPLRRADVAGSRRFGRTVRHEQPLRRAGLRLPDRYGRDGAGRVLAEPRLPVAQPLHARPSLLVAVQRHRRHLAGVRLDGLQADRDRSPDRRRSARCPRIVPFALRTDPQRVEGCAGRVRADGRNTRQRYGPYLPARDRSGENHRERQARIGPQGYGRRKRDGRTYRTACRLGRLPDRRREIAGPGVRTRSGGESA